MTTPLITADAVYSGFSAVFDSLTINDIVSVTPAANVKKIIAQGGGMVDMSLIAEQYREPTVKLAALNIGAIMTAVSATLGLAVASSAKIQYQLRADGGTFDAAANHISLSTAKGFLLPVSIRMEQDSEQGAQIELEFWPLVTSTNPPLIVNISQALTGTPAVAALFRLGPVGFEGSVLGGVKSVAVNFGLEYKPFRAGGQTGAAVGFIRKRNPTIEIETTNQRILSSIGFGISGISTGLTIGCAQIGYALTGLNHTKITMATGSYEITDAGYSGEGDAMAKITATATGTLTVANSTNLA